MANAVVLSEHVVPIRSGSWDRTPWVATRYELELAIQGLLDRGKLAVDAGREPYKTSDDVSTDPWHHQPGER